MDYPETFLREEDPFIDPSELRAANFRHDAEMARLNFHPSARLRSAWKPNIGILKGPLTDKKIANYEKEGFYSEEFRAARRSKMIKKSIRSGNFILRDGKLIFAPS